MKKLLLIATMTALLVSAWTDSASAGRRHRRCCRGGGCYAGSCCR